MTWLAQKWKEWSDAPRKRDLLKRIVSSTDDKAMLIDDVIRLNERDKRREPRTFEFATFLFLYVGVTTLYTEIFYVLPFLYRESGPDRLRTERLICAWCAFQCLLNWLLTRYISSSFSTNTSLVKFVPGPEHRTTREQATSGEKVNHLSWTYCNKCQRWVPPRCHHCRICNHCILKRDHHCYFSGVCVGHKNQRFFVVLLVYITCCMFWYPYGMLEYVQSGDHGYMVTWTDFLPPVTFYHFVYDTLSFHVMNTIFFLWFCIPLFFLGPLMLLNQIFQICMGWTEFESSKYLNIVCTKPLNARFREVFGRYWALDVLLPLHTIFPVECDGIQWPNHYDSDFHTLRRIKEI